MHDSASPLLVAPKGQASHDRLSPFISVIVPVRNEARFIRRTLVQLLRQHYRADCFEILVIDGESNDGTAGIVAEYVERGKNVRLFSNPRRWSSAARNIGIREAKGEILVIVDGHCELDDNRYLEKLAAAFGRSGADCIGRPQPLDVSEATPLQQAIAAARSSWLGHHPDSYIYSSEERFVPAKSVAVAYRRSVFEKVGLFDESFDACEDVELNHRIDQAGLRCYFAPEAAVRYCPRASLIGLFRQLVRYGRGRTRLWRKHPTECSWRTFLPGVFVCGLTTGPFFCQVANWLAMVYAAMLLLYVSLVVVISLVIGARRGGALVALWLPVVFATVHIASGTGLVVEALPRLRRPFDRQGAS